MNIKELIEQIRRDPECVVEPPADLPVIEGILPADLAQFYALCGGVSLFQRKNVYGLRIVSAVDMMNANLCIVGQRLPGEFSDSWYLIAEDAQHNQFVSIDCAVERSGRCYDSFWDHHAEVGDSAIIALSFTELLARLWLSRGSRHYWLAPGAPAYGDAYDKA